jgi:hypothetical protein
VDGASRISFRIGGRVGLLTGTWPFFGLTFDREILKVTAPFCPSLDLTRPQVLDIVPVGRGLYGSPCRLVVTDGAIPSSSIWNNPKNGLALTQRAIDALRRCGWPVEAAI